MSVFFPELKSKRLHLLRLYTNVKQITSGKLLIIADKYPLMVLFSVIC